jgi:hypothetical protein
LLFILAIGFSIQLVQAYDNSQYGFSINAPSGWTTTEEADVIVMFASPDEFAFINVVVEETNLALNDYITAAKQELESTFDDYQLQSERNRNIGGLNCYEIVSTWVQEGFEIEIRQVVFIEKGQAFIITYGAFAEDYDTYSPEAEQSIQSFRVSGTGAVGGLPIMTIIIIIAVVVGAVVAVVAILLFRRKRKPAETQMSRQAPLTYPPPPPPT